MSTVKHGGGGVMILACFAVIEPSTVHLPDKPSQTSSIGLCRARLKPLSSRIVQQLVEKSAIRSFDWPLYSHDGMKSHCGQKNYVFFMHQSANMFISAKFNGDLLFCS